MRDPLPTTTALRPLALALFAALPLLGGHAAHAQQAAPAASVQAFRIGAGPLALVLNQFASEAGILLSANAALTDGKTSPGLQASGVTVEQGLQQLLAGSGLQARRQPDGSFIVQAAREDSPSAALPASTTSLPSVTVVAAASPSPADAGSSYQPTPSATTLRSALPVLEVPQIVNVVPAQAIRDQRPRNIDDALANVSGITQGNTLAGTQDTIMKRGFGGNRDGSIMHNGMPLVQGHGMNAAAESVEVVKGPSSLLYGIMDPGGVVNVVSKKPQLRDRTTLSLLGSGYAGGKTGGGVTLDTTGAIGENGLAYRLVADHVDEDYWRVYGTRRETLLAPSIAWYGDDTQAVLSYEYRDFLTPFDRGTALDPNTKRPLAIPRTRRLDEPFNDMRGDSHLAQLAVDHRLSPDWKAHLGLGYNRETYDANQFRVSGINTTTGTLQRSNDATHGALSTDSYGIAYVDGHAQLGGMRHDVQLGADVEYRRIYRADLLRQATTSTFSYLNPVYGHEKPSTTVSASDSGQSDQLHNHALFLQDAVHLSDHWIAVAGLRYQAYSQVAGRGRPFKANTDTSDSTWLPRAGLVYRATDTLSYYASYTQSLKPASTIAPLASGLVIDSGIAPEEARSWEVGAKLEIPGGLTSSLALYDIKKKNVLVSQFNDVTKLTDWRTSGAARSRGLELDVAGQLSSRWSGIASYAYTDAKTTQDPLFAGNRLWNVARQTASVSAVYDAGNLFGAGQLRVGAGARYVGRRPGDSANTFELPSYAVADAFATYDTRIGAQKVKFQLNVKNLFDRTYYTSSANTYFISMGDVRQVSLLTSFEF